MIREIGASIRGVLARGEPVLVLLAGPNGAGKSTFFRDYLQSLELPFVNADAIARQLREAAISGEAEDLERRAFEDAEEQRNSLLEERLSFCTETVFSDPYGAKLGLLKRARASGYATFLVFIGLGDPKLSIARVTYRVELGGHDVPTDRLLGRFPRTFANLRNAVPLVNETFLLDNSSDLDPFRLVAVYSEGQLIWKTDRLPAWAAGLPGL